MFCRFVTWNVYIPHYDVEATKRQYHYISNQNEPGPENICTPVRSQFPDSFSFALLRWEKDARQPPQSVPLAAGTVQSACKLVGLTMGVLLH